MQKNFISYFNFFSENGLQMIAKNYSITESDTDEQNDSEPKNLSSLEDHCFLIILEKLTLDDLSEMSQTCKRFHGLCVNQFQNCYKEKVFIIDGVSNDGTPIYGPYDKKYPAAFAKYTRNVIFGGKCANEATLQQLKTYYAKPEVASIKHLGFQNWFMNKSHSRFFVNMVKDVESVTFTNTYIDGDLNECVLY